MSTEALLRSEYNQSYEFITFKTRISKYTDYLLISDQIRQEQALDRDNKGLNWFPEGFLWVLLWPKECWWEHYLVI